MKKRFFPPRVGDPVFTRQQLTSLLIPLIVEQILTQMIGLIGTVMVARVGEHALSGVSIVDSINQIVLSLFTSLSIGGTIVTSQFIGRADNTNARESAKQVVIASTGIAALCAVICAFFRVNILEFIYDVEPDVMASAKIYFLITACSFPFMALFASTSAIFRASGNSSLPMMVSLLMNAINIGCCALFIIVIPLGAAGPALGALISRIVGSIILSTMLSNKKLAINISGIFPLRLNIPMIKNILVIGIPSGVENSMLQLGRLVNQSMISSFGTAAIVAASIGNHLNVVTLMPGAAVGSALLTVVGQCVGAGKYDQARRYTTGFMLMGMAATVSLNVLCLVFMEQLIVMFNASGETAVLARDAIMIFGIASCFFAPFSFPLPNALRAANDVKFTLLLALASMFPVRVLMGYILCFHTPIGAQGIWWALLLDWGFKAIVCIIRFSGDKWTKHKILKGAAPEPEAITQGAE